MPPKGKKGKSGNKKSKKSQEMTRPTEKESFLQSELDRRVRELADIKLRAHAAQEENILLNEEANKVRTAMGEYMHFMSKKTNYRQTQIVTLNDYHRKQIEDINREKDNMLSESKQKKQELQSQLMEKEQLLIQTQEELEAMNEFKIIQEQHHDAMKRLENEISRIRNEHVNEISRMKFNFEKETQQQRTNENAKVEQIRRQADKEAEQFLYDQRVSIQNENIELRTALQKILKRTKELNDLKEHLEEEQLRLISRIKLTADLRKIRLDKLSCSIPEDQSKLMPY